MFKLILIVALLVLLVFFITKRFNMFSTANASDYLPQSDWQKITLPPSIARRIAWQTLTSVGIGFLVMIVVLILAAKFKIILILLPISFYLIGQYFILLNQIKVLKSQSLFFNAKSNQLKIQSKNRNDIYIALIQEQIKIKEVKAVQKNRHLLFGYFELRTSQQTIFVPSILAENLQNKKFFDRLNQFPREIESKLFPII